MNLRTCISGHCHAQPAAGPPDISEENCRTQGCCWDPLETVDPHIDLADCFFANNGRSNYQLVHSEQQGMLFHCSSQQCRGTCSALSALHCFWQQLHGVHRLQRQHVADGLCMSAAIGATAGVHGPAGLASGCLVHGSSDERWQDQLRSSTTPQPDGVSSLHANEQ